MSHLSIKGIPHRYTGRSSAAAHQGRVGCADRSARAILHDAGIRAFCRAFNRRFDQKAETDRPEWRTFAAAERRAHPAAA